MQTSSQTPARTKAQSADDIADAALASLRRLSPSAQARHLRKMTPAELQALDLAMQRAERAQQSAGGRALSRYRDDPAGFASDVLGVRLWSRQIEICRAVAEHPRVAVRSGHKVGKALALDTPIPTPSGWTTMGEVAVGDTVFDERGRPCTVTAATDVMYGHPCFDVEFSDGTIVTADADHQWVTWTAAARRARDRGSARAAASTVTTAEIAATLHSKNRGRNHAVAVAEPIECPPAALPIDPYVLGVWLGDGTSVSSAITSPDLEIIAELERRGCAVVQGGQKGLAWTWRIRLPGDVPLCTELRRAGLLNNKRVPDAYLRASQAQRRDLLAGLLDTDGHVTTRGLVSFDNTNEQLARGVFELAASLGFKPTWHEDRATLYGKDCGPAYRVSFTPHENVFRLPRKAARITGPRSKATWVHQRMIVAARPRESVPVRCIQVDAPSRQFLCSRAFVPTHNSTSAVVLALWWVCTRERGYVAMTSATARQVRAVLWRELRHVYRKHRSVDGALIDPSERIGGTLHKVPDRGLEFEDDRAIIGFTADSAENAAGISGAEVLFIVDEASGVEGQIFDALEGNRAGGARMVMFGNPTKTTGEFHAAFHAKRPFYRTVHVSSEEAAEVTPPIPGLATRAWVDEKRAEWGIDSPLYAVRVAGNFPRQSANAVIGVDVVEAAIARWRDAFGQGDDSDTALERATLEGSEPLRIGVDVARYGDDESIIATRRGRAVYDLRAFQGLDGPQLAGHVIVAARERRRGEEPVVVAVDETGVGASCLDALRAASPPWLTVVGVNSASAPREGETYLNLRAQLAFDLRDFLRGGGAIPDDSHAAQELVATTYSFGARNRIQIVSKDDLKKQIGRSPDRFDALALAVFEPRVEAVPQNVMADLARFRPQPTRTRM